MSYYPSHRWFIGLASGGCGAGVDAVLAEVEGAGTDLRVRLLHGYHQPHGRELREMVLRLADGGSAEVRELGLLHRLLGESFAAAARQVADRASFSLQDVFCVGLPGFPLFHETEGRFPSTLSWGMAEIVAERTGVTTLADFRTRDLAAGGQGTSVAALADALLLSDPAEDRLLINLGGSARVTFLPGSPGHLPFRPAEPGRHAGPPSPPADVRSFEAGPCNLLLDALIRQVSGRREWFDAGGKHAVQGRCLDEPLREWLRHPFFSRTPPRSLPRLCFGDQFALQAIDQVRRAGGSPYDLLCTASHFAIDALTAAVDRFVPGSESTRVLLSGGGTRNGFLLQLLRQKWPGRVIERTDACGVPAEFRDALCHAVLGVLTVDGLPGNVPAITGAAGYRLLGRFTPGSAVNWARCLSWMAHQTAPLAAESA